jgi:hypothetical protein
LCSQLFARCRSVCFSWSSYRQAALSMWQCNNRSVRRDVSYKPFTSCFKDRKSSMWKTATDEGTCI